jgi:hypothetical protein
MHSSDITPIFNVHNKTPFIVPEEVHEEDETDRRQNKLGVVRMGRTTMGRRAVGGRSRSPQRRYSTYMAI